MATAEFKAMISQGWNAKCGDAIPFLPPTDPWLYVSARVSRRYATY